MTDITVTWMDEETGIEMIAHFITMAAARECASIQSDGGQSVITITSPFSKRVIEYKDTNRTTDNTHSRPVDIGIGIKVAFDSHMDIRRGRYGLQLTPDQALKLADLINQWANKEGTDS